MSSPAARRVIEVLINRLFATMTRGPAINCFPGRSRQRVDLAALESLGGPAPSELLATLMSEARRVRFVVKLKALPPAPPDDTLEPPALRQQRRIMNERAALLRRLAWIAEEAQSRERDTGVWTLQLGYPLLIFQTLCMDPNRNRQALVFAPLAFAPLRLSVRLGVKPFVVLECAAEGADRVIPNPALRAWLERETGERMPELNEDAEGVNPAGEVQEITQAVCALLRVGDPPPLDSWPVQPVPGREALPHIPRVLPAGVLGLFPLTNQCTLMDLEALRDAPELPPTVAPFLSVSGGRHGVRWQGHREQPARQTGIATPGTSSSRSAISSVADEHLIAPADPCQRRAVALARSAPVLVIHGPPGTGKSQTIVNIIGDTLAHGERALLVCEKRTALDVVMARLEALGLASLCALVHDASRDREPLFKDVRAQLEALAQTQPTPDPAAGLKRVNAEMKRLRTDLERYYDALSEPDLHSDASPDGSVSLSFHELAGRWLEWETAVQSGETGRKSNGQGTAPAIALPKGLTAVPLNYLLEHEGDLRRTLERAVQADWRLNPWTTEHNGDLTGFLRRPVDEVRAAMAACTAAARRVKSLWLAGLPGFDPKADTAGQGARRAECAAALKALLERSPDAAAVARLSPEAAAEAREKLSGLAIYRARLEAGPPAADLLRTFDAQPWTLEDVRAELAAVREWLEHGTGLMGFWRLGLRRRARDTVKRFRLQMSRRAVERIREFLEGMEARLVLKEFLAEYLGEVRTQKASRDDALRRLIDSSKRLLRFLTTADMDEALRPIAPLVRHAMLEPRDAPCVIAALEASREIGAALAEAKAALESCGLFTAKALAQRCERLTAGDPDDEGLAALESALPHLENVLRFEQEAASYPKPLGKALRVLARAGLSTEDAWRHLMAGYYRALAMERLAARPELLELDPLQLERAFKRLGELQNKKLSIECDAIRHRWLTHQRRRLMAESGTRLNQTAADLRRRLLLRGRNASRLRQAVHHGLNCPEGDPLFDFKPVWLTSPQTVSQIFPLSPIFDVVIYDEASQCALEEGLPTLARGRRVVVAGDQHQLPPTRFFESVAGPLDEAALPDDATPDNLFIAQQSETEDLLSAALNINVEQVWLDVHYRSARGELIAYSNTHFYNGRLQPLPPHPARPAETPALLLHRVEGVYSDQQNEREAAWIIERLGQLLAEPSPPSIGIVTFNLPQKELILDRLAEAEERDRAFAHRLAEARERWRKDQFDGLFVKNLETVQGDERDVILISTTFGPDSNGRFYRRFGPLSAPGGERRLNVIITRARRAIEVVTSIPPSVYRVQSDAPAGLCPTGSWHLLSYLKFIEDLNHVDRAHHSEMSSSAAAAAVNQSALDNVIRSRFVEVLAGRLAAQMPSPGSMLTFYGPPGFCVDLVLNVAADGMNASRATGNMAVSERRLDAGFGAPGGTESDWIGVLCDATRYAGAQGDRLSWDLFREEVLRRCGWRLVRLWTPHYFRDPKAALDMLNL